LSWHYSSSSSVPSSTTNLTPADGEPTWPHRDWRPMATSAAIANTQGSLPYNGEDDKTKAAGSPSLAAQQTVARARLQSGSVDTTVYTLPHPIWKGEFIDAVEITHEPPQHFVDKLAYNTVRLTRFNFDWMSGYSWGRLSEEKWLRRIIFLETVAGVPGSVAAILRHLRSLRKMKRDHGWIHTLLEEAENERMHLLTALKLKQPSMLFRAAVWLSQGIFFNFFFASYLISPRFCHRFVGYLEEEAVKTYTHLLRDLDENKLPKWNDLPAPDIARQYWKLSEDAKWRDVVAVIRADEAHHRDVNHTFAGLQLEHPNPFPPGH